MSEFSKQDIEQRKKAIFDTMSSRSQKRIERYGYDKWDPFQEPKDPIDIRKDKTRRTSQQLIREFLQAQKAEDYSNAFGQGVVDICMGIINNDERYKGMYEFACWYKELLKKENIND